MQPSTEPTPPGPKPDDILVDWLGSTFGKGLIWYLAGLTFFLLAWWGFLRGSVTFGARAAKATSTAYGTLRTKPRAHRVFVLISTTLLAGVQCLWLYVAFLVGNMLSFYFEERTTPIVPLGFDNIHTPVGPPVLDNISTLYVLFVLLNLYLAGRGEAKLDEHNVRLWGSIAGAPSFYWGITAVPVLLHWLSLLWTDDAPFLPPDLYSPAIIALTAFSYLITCYIAMSCSVLLVRLWRRP